MVMMMTCPECGEHDNIGVNFTVHVTSDGLVKTLDLDYTCLRCDHEWLVITNELTVKKEC